MAKKAPPPLAGGVLDHLRAGARVTQTRLPFYQKTVVVEVLFPDFPSQPLGYLVSGDGAYVPLAGDAQPIHRVNDREKLNLDPGTCLPYLKFFCRYLRSVKGNFLVLETGWEDEQVDLFALRGVEEGQALVDRVTPPVVESDLADGRFQVRAWVRHGDEVSRCLFVITPRGEVEMEEETRFWPPEACLAPGS